MKNKILNLIQEYPRHFTVKIKKDPVLLKWVEDNSSAPDDSTLLEKIYSAVNDVKLICPNGNKTPVKRFNSGPQFCGHQSVCQCSLESTKSSVEKSKSKISVTEKEKSNNKRRITLKNKTGYEYNSQRPEVKEKLKESRLPEKIRILLEDKEWLSDQYLTQNKSGLQIANEIGCYYGTVLSYCQKYGFGIQQNYKRSIVEIEIQEFIESLGFKTETNRQDLLSGRMEIDIYVPDKRVGIEVNGLYYHSQPSSLGYDELKTKHLKKTESAEKNDILLFHVTDWEWKNKKDIIESMIRSKLGKTERIYGRKCEIGIPDKTEARKFFEDNHLQGHCNAKYYFGLKYLGEWVSMISLGKPRFGSEYDLELIRMSNKKNFTIVGGFSKMLKFVDSTLDKPSIISFCDRSKSNGRGYISSGFVLDRYTGPGYYWTDTKDIISRERTKKDKIKKWLKGYDPNKSQSENMFSSGYRRYWDCGNFVFVRNSPSIKTS